MSRLTYKAAGVVYEDPSIPESQFCVYVDGYPILKKTAYQTEDIPNYYNAVNSVGFAPFFIDQDQVRLEVVEHISPVGALKFTRKNDPEAWMVCDLFELRKNNVFYEIYQMTEDHQTPFCLKSPRQLQLELAERQDAAKKVIDSRQVN